MASSSTSKTLHSPYSMGKFALSHRIVFASVSRYRSYYSIPQPHAALYYSQRATNGGLLISERVGVSSIALEDKNAPGIWSSEQVEAWRPITRAVHKKKGIFFCQLGHVGRVSTSIEWGQPVSSTRKKLTGSGWIAPKRLQITEIPNIIDEFKLAARNAIEAGFDGVEIDGANGFLVEQFLKDGVNNRGDNYGGSIKNRCRFAVELVHAIVREIGADRVGIKLSPFLEEFECADTQPAELGEYMAKELHSLNICYLHVLANAMEILEGGNIVAPSFHRIRQAFQGATIITGGYHKDSGNSVIRANSTDLVAFGDLFVANPDLPRRFELNIEKFNRLNVFKIRDMDPVQGYTDYPFLGGVEEEIPTDIIPPIEINEFFKPYKMGKFNLAHRVVLGPINMNRSYYGIPQPHAAIYYSQRTTTGGLLISETTAVSDMGKRHRHTPGIWSRQQVVAWKPIVEAVHEKGGIFFCSLGHFGRNVDIAGRTPVSSTDKAETISGVDRPVPRRLQLEELPGIVSDFRVAARNAIDAGFDGVEIEGGSGSLIDQFLDGGVNDRTDEYGGELENRCRFALEIITAVALEIGADRVGVGLTPWGYFYLWDNPQSCDPQHGSLLGEYMANALNTLNILYVRSQIQFNLPTENDNTISYCHGMKLHFKKTFIASNGYDRVQGFDALTDLLKDINGQLRAFNTDLVSFAHLFAVNPDLVRRFRLGATNLNQMVPETTDSEDPVSGYTDYPFLP